MVTQRAPRFTTDTTPEERGLLRAACEGVEVRQVAPGIYRVSSVSRPGSWHRVIDLRCDCEAAQAGRHCKHVSAVLMYHEQRQAEHKAHRCTHCGHYGQDVSVHVEYIGGCGLVEVIRCNDQAACWRRFDGANGL